jgi:hypothetical protein
MMSPPLGSTWLCRRQTSTFRATSVFPAPSYPGDEGAEVRAGDIMANADVGLAHSEKHSIGDGTAKRRLGRAAQCGLTDATQARK